MNSAIKKYGLSFEKAIKKWEEAIPLGNGKLGALIYGEGPVILALDRIDLWDNRESEGAKHKDFSYKTLIECAKGGEEGWKRKKEIFGINDNFPYPSKLSAGRLLFDFGEKHENINSKLDISDATLDMSFGKNKITGFMSATDFVGVLRVFGNYKLDIHIPDYFSGDENGEWVAPSGLVDNDGTIEIIENGCLKYPRSKGVEKDGEFIYYKQSTLTDYAFGAVVLVKKMNGYDEIYYTVATTDDSEDYIASAKKELTSAAEKGYEKLYAEHARWWKKYWEKSSVTLPDKALERAYYFSWYLFASTSRKGQYPMPLQGVWTADSNALPPWNGDYHHDLNTQMSYWGYAKANRLEEGRVFADYLWNLRPAFRAFTKKVFGVKGCLLPGLSTLDGKYMGCCSHYSFSPTLTVWAAKAFDDYYRYTGDEKYLRTRAYPFFSEVEKAVRALFTVRDGRYYLPLSSSPEVFESRMETFSIGNTNFDQSLIIYLYQTLIDYAERLGIDKSVYEEVLSRLDPLYLTPDGGLMLSEKARLPYSHRHHSHLMAIYPLCQITYDSAEERKIIDASMLELEQLGTGWWTAFAFPWCATLYTKQYNGNAAYEKLRAFVKGFISKNGFHLNGDYKKYGFTQWHYQPFTLESLYTYCDSVQEMLLKDEMGYIELFPALPDEWDGEISFKTLRTRGGALISATMKNRRIIKFSIKSAKPTKIVIKNNFAGSEGFTVCGKKYDAPLGELIELEIERGEAKFEF